MKFCRKPITFLYAGILILLPVLTAIIFISWHYAAQPTYVVKTLARMLALKTIAIATMIYDPVKPVNVKTSPTLVKQQITGLCGTTSLEFKRLMEGYFPSHNVSIQVFDNNPIIRSTYSFGYQTVPNDHLTRLKSKYRLDSQINPRENDFEQITDLSDWIKRQWQHGTSGSASFDPVNFDADTVLSMARHGEQFWCQAYAMTLIQLGSAMGSQARLVALSSDGYTTASYHAVSEVWSNYYRKWVMIDTDFNLWYTRNGIPLSVLEIHDAVMSNQGHLLQVSKGGARSQVEYEQRIPSLLKFYRYFDIDMRNDWMTNPYFKGHPARSDRATLTWEDNRLPPVFNNKTKVNDPRELYWDLNTTSMSLCEKFPSDNTITICLDTVTPNFSHFEIEVDHSAPITVNSSRFNWHVHEGSNSIEVLSVNAVGRKGSMSRVSVEIE